jgi:uncharacterized membrane protein YkvA (DUF1232 family)
MAQGLSTMSELLRLISLIQTAASAQSYARAAAWILGAIVIWWLWGAESAVLRLIAFVGADAAVCVGIWYFLKAPVEWAKYLFVNAVFLMLGLSRVFIKAIVMGIAILLSIIYFLSPLDFIPDILLGLGWIDDVLVAIGLISYAANSKFTIPVPSISAEEAADRPGWKVALVATLGTILTLIVRAATG